MEDHKSLSKHGFNNLHQQVEDGSNTSPTDKLVVQLLTQEETNKGCFNLTLSDGITKETCMTYKNSTDVFRGFKNIPNYSILYVDILFFKGNTMIIKGLESVRTDVSRLIGDPILYKDYVDGGRRERNIDCSIQRPKPQEQKNPQKSFASENNSTQVTSNFIPSFKGKGMKSVQLEDSAYHKVSLIDGDATKFVLKVVCKSKSPVR